MISKKPTDIAKTTTEKKMVVIDMGGLTRDEFVAKAMKIAEEEGYFDEATM